MYETGAFRKGLKIEFEGLPYVITDFQHVSPGKGAAFTRTKMKNLLTNNTIERNIRSGEKVGVPNIEEKQYQYMYSDNEGYHLMDQKNFEQIALSEEQVGDQKNYFQEGANIRKPATLAELSHEASIPAGCFQSVTELIHLTNRKYGKETAQPGQYPSQNRLSFRIFVGFNNG